MQFESFHWLSHRGLRSIIDPIHKWGQFKILLYTFKLDQLTSFESKNSFELSTRKRG